MRVVFSHAVATCLVLALLVPTLVQAARPAVVDVTVREVPAEDLWQVSYRLPAGTAGVDLVHGRGAYRRTGWGVAPASSQWVEAPAGERLCFPRRGRDFAATFRTDDGRRPKDYETHVKMSDGGRLIYTGQLVVRPLSRCAAGTEAEPLARPVVHRFRFETDAKRTVRVADRAAEGSLTWEPPAGAEETYAYFGPQAATSGDRIAVVADPAVPDWLRKELEPTMAQLLDRFGSETGLTLPTRPLVLLSFDPHGHGMSFGGGVLHGVVQVDLGGEGFANDGAETRRYWVVHVAHELFHLWDGSTLHPDAESEWLSEAAAEAFALRAAYGLGALSERQLAERLVGLANRCLGGLEGQSLLSAPERGAWDTWYTCGPVLLFVAGASVERAHPGEGGLGLLVREMFAEGQRAGDVYGTGTFLGWLDKLSGDRDTVFALQRLIRRGIPTGADRFLAQLLAAAGYRVRLGAPEEATGDPEVFRTLLRKGLLRCACAGASVAAAPGTDCSRLGGEVPLERIDELEVRRGPAAAYGRLRSAALLARPVRVMVGDDDVPLTLLCGRDSLDPSFEQLLRLE